MHMPESRIWLPLLMAAASLPEGLDRPFPAAEHVVRVATRIKDADLLRVSLREFGAEPASFEGTLHASVDGGPVEFEPSAHGRMEAVFPPGTSEERAHSVVLAVEQEYARHLRASRNRPPPAN
jgi:hypothetical protein